MNKMSVKQLSKTFCRQTSFWKVDFLTHAVVVLFKLPVMVAKVERSFIK
jgi:hypothetical protein